MSGISKKNIDQSLKFVYSDNNSLSVIFHDNNLLMGVVGEFNKNLQELEKITNSSLYSRGNSILIKSNPETNEKVKNAIQFLADQFINNGSIENKDIISSVDKFMISEKIKNNNLLIFSDFNNEIKKTKEMSLILKKFEILNSLIILDKSSKNKVEKSIRNIPNIKVTDINHFSAFDIVKFEKVVFTETSVKELEKRYA